MHACSLSNDLRAVLLEQAIVLSDLLERLESLRHGAFRWSQHGVKPLPYLVTTVSPQGARNIWYDSWRCVHFQLSTIFWFGPGHR